MIKHRPEIALLDDDSLAYDAARLALGDEIILTGFKDPRAAEEWIRRRLPPVVLLDLHLGEGTSLDWLAAWKEKFPDTELIVVSGETRIEWAVETMRRGATDYVVKPFRPETLRLSVDRALEKRALKERVGRLDSLLRPRPVQLVGASAASHELTSKISLLKGQTHLNVLILGESGTGKEIVARSLHQQEDSAARPFVVANMPAVPASLMEAELFGVEKGAFTDAKEARAGKFELAEGGDIFLDEIGDLALDTQAKLLRTLQERQVERLGDSRPRRIEFRAISATNQPLAELISHGKFREDLMYRLSDMVLWLPPLRERKDDIIPLAHHFVRKYTPRGAAPELGPRAIEQLTGYEWPGNVRQLESTIKRALVFRRGDVIEDIELHDPASPVPRIGIDAALSHPTAHSEHMAQEEKRLIEGVLRKHRGDRQAAMAELRLSRATFYRKIQALKIALH